MHLLRFPRLVILSSLLLIVLLAFAPGVSASIRHNVSSPAIMLTPTVGPPTSTVQVSGTNFGNNEKVDVYFDTTDEVLTSTNSQGMFSTSFQVPAGATPGTHTVSAVGRSSKLTAQAPFLVQADWPQFRYNLHHIGTNPYENVLNTTNAANLTVAWSAPPGNSYDTSPAVANGVVYFSTDNSLNAYNAQTGGLLWSAGIDGVGDAPTVVNGVVYVAAGSLYAFNASSGALLWSTQVMHGVDNSPTVANGIVYVGTGISGGGNIYAYNAQTGSLLWSAFTINLVASSAAVANGVLYVGTGDGYKSGYLYAFNAQTGSQLWSTRTGSVYNSSPSVVKGVVYIGAGISGSGNVYAFNASTGKQLWASPIGNATNSSPSVVNGVVYIGSRNKHVYALNAQTGAILWSAPVGKSINSSPAVANGVVYIGSDKMYAFNAQTGTQLWSFSPGVGINSSPVVANGEVYVGSVHGFLYAFALPPQNQPQPPARPNPATLQPNFRL